MWHTVSPDRIPTIGRRRSLAQEAYKAIRRSLRDGILVHDEFYSEAELAHSMGISRTPVREALIEMAREGLVEVVPQRGFKLRELGPEDEREVFELRGVLESYVVRRLASKATPGDVSKLREVLDRQAELVDNPSAFLEVDEEFHLLMPQLVGLRLTYQMVFILRGALWLMGSAALALPERGPTVLQEHRAVVDAIEASDPDAAMAAIQYHINETAVAVYASRSDTDG
jgi:GntR family transcriptional regulator, rspAB operon transcriptional repressor